MTFFFLFVGRWGYLTNFVGESYQERRIAGQWVHHELRVMTKNWIIWYCTSSCYGL